MQNSQVKKLPSRNIAPIPKTNPNPNPNTNRGLFSTETIFWSPHNPKTNPELGPNPSLNRGGQFSSGVQLSGYRIGLIRRKLSAMNGRGLTSRLLGYYLFNDTHLEELALYWIQHKNSLKYIMFTQSVKCLKKVIHQKNGKSEWLHHSVIFTAKLELVFVLTFENAFS